MIGCITSKVLGLLLNPKTLVKRKKKNFFERLGVGPGSALHNLLPVHPSVSRRK